MSNALSRDLARLVRQAEDAAPKGGRWRQRLHLCPPTGWLNDPNGLCQTGGTFHAFFQYAPFDAEGGLKLWGHCESDDLVGWRYVGAPLLADQPFDCHGVYSGSAVVEDGRIRVLYTGNVKLEDGAYDYVTSGREANTVLVESADGGRTFGRKHVVMTNADYPADETCHVRDPKVWRVGEEGAGRGATCAGADGEGAGSAAAVGADEAAPRYLMVQGARRAAPAEVPSVPSRYCAAFGERAGVDVGEVLVFSSPDLSRWRLERRVCSPERFGFMWECPDYFELPGAAGGPVAHVLSVSPQGLEGGDWERRNVYQSGYFLLDAPLLEASSPDPARFCLWDVGFDFYAPQTFLAKDGRRILVGWMGMPDEPAHVNKTLADGWQHCLAVPREVTFEGGRVLQRPVRELARRRVRGERAAWTCERRGSVAFDLVVDGVGSSVVVRLAGELSLSWDEGAGWLELRFSREGADGVGGGRGVRREPVAALRDLRVVGDASSVEVFANGGELVMSTRYYPEEYSLAVDAPGAEVSLWDLEA